MTTLQGILAIVSVGILLGGYLVVYTKMYRNAIMQIEREKQMKDEQCPSLDNDKSEE